jgi:hypothetical protein
MCIYVSIFLNVIKVCNQFCCMQLDFLLNECFHYVDLQDYIIKLNCRKKSIILFIIIGNIKKCLENIQWVLLHAF